MSNSLPEFTPSPYKPSMTPTLLFEDTHLVVLDKPAGLLSQGEVTGDANLVDWLRGHFGRHYVGLVHRLDRNTSGLMVVAKRTKSAQRLTDALQKGELERHYLAWILGELTGKARWEHFLRKDPRTNEVAIVADATAGPAGTGPGTGPKDAKRAILTASPLGRGSWRGIRLTLAEFELETGRSHQIRVQSAAQGHPLLGDTKYSPPGTPREALQFGRPALHSHRIRFPHPMTKEILEFRSELPKDMGALLKKPE